MCKYCEYPDANSTSMTTKHDLGDGYSVSYDIETKSFNMFTWEKDNISMGITKINGVKYCPFCGEKFKAPAKNTIKFEKDYKKLWEKQKELYRKKKEKERKEHEKWLEREYKKNPYDPTKPIIKNPNLRNAVRNLAKYMKITRFYWDDDLRRFMGWEGGYIDLKEGGIGPCYETNGVMEDYHKSNGKTYTVRELCYGFKEEKGE